MLLHMLLIFSFGAVDCAKILFFTYIPSVSHQYVFQSIWKELSLRGHEVTAIATDPLHDTSLTNLREIDVSVGYKTFEKFDYSNLSSEAVGIFGTTDGFIESFMYALNLEMQTEEFQDLLKKPEDYFDLLIVETHNPTAFGIQNKFTAPMIGISSMAGANILYEFLGSPVHPILYPEVTVEQDVTDFNLSLSTKFYRLFIGLGLWLKYNFHYFQQAEIDAQKYFGKGKHHIVDTIRNLDLLLVNTNPIFSNRRPNAPNIIEYYNVHEGRRNSMNDDLQKILDDAKEGAIYFSLGTNVRFDHVQGNIKQAILEALGELPYRARVQELRSIFLDQPMSGIDRIIWWCEYVIRHKGAKHLRSPSADIPLYEYFMLDVFAVIFTALFVMYKIVIFAVRRLVGPLGGRKNKEASEKKTN
ncbi:hypothetical protein WA026_018368 [Henosepilachna vigintioctopunctata]|uniref:UDP-glucuronosyltransferase n=1 Tax=Henosepilachna vigintioctopunctata TaxID=420089 RepID=A0AAW1V8X1_9CUCU